MQINPPQDNQPLLPSETPGDAPTGASFPIASIPQREEASIANSLLSSSPKPPCMKTILIVEDEQAIRLNLTKLLNAEGFRTIATDNGWAGVQLAQQAQPDLIICDILMPELDGYGVLKALQQDSLTATIPFIFLTAKADRADWRLGMNLGADDYLTKPFQRTELLDAIAIRLKKQASRDRQHTFELNRAQAQLDYLLHYDRLTALPNRLFLQEQFDRLLGEIHPSIRQIPILSLGVKQLSWLNHSLGPSSGDLLLQAVARRLIKCVGPSDIVAQLSSDRFIILLTETTQRQQVSQMAQTLLDAFSSPFLVGANEIFLSGARIGIAFFGQDGCDLDTLILHADMAREEAKKPGKNSYQFYIASIGSKSQEALFLELQLRQALKRGEFQIYYQPKVNLRTGEILGAEALVRWHHPERGSISPAEFIPLAERTGFIIPLGEWILRTACRQAQVWQAAGFSPFRIAVNLSGEQFNQPHLSALVVKILQDTGLDPSYLELELTESTVMQNPESAIATLDRLKSLGILISIDDFGTGYSSLSYLSKFPFDILKIDRSFVCQLTENRKNAAITTAILQMARSLNLKVVAEGVETEAELAFLSKHHCDRIQGYWFSPPVSAKRFGELLRGGKRFPLCRID